MTELTSRANPPLEMRGAVERIYQREKNYSITLTGIKDIDNKIIYFSGFGTCPVKKGQSVHLTYTKKRSDDGIKTFYNITGFEKDYNISGFKKDIEKESTASSGEVKTPQKIEIAGTPNNSTPPSGVNEERLSSVEFNRRKNAAIKAQCAVKIAAKQMSAQWPNITEELYGDKLEKYALAAAEAIGNVEKKLLE